MVTEASKSSCKDRIPVQTSSCTCLHTYISFNKFTLFHTEKGYTCNPRTKDRSHLHVPCHTVDLVIALLS